MEIHGRGRVEGCINQHLQQIPTNPKDIDMPVDKVQMLVLKTYSFIRSQVCDQVELFAESFFKLPMLRRLEEDMAAIELSEVDRKNYHDRRERLGAQIQKAQDSVVEVSECIARLLN